VYELQRATQSVTDSKLVLDLERVNRRLDKLDREHEIVSRMELLLEATQERVTMLEQASGRYDLTEPELICALEEHAGLAQLWANMGEKP
jgi:hypothetical protein